MVYDPDAGPSLSDRLDLDGNPEIDQDWPTYELKYKDENGKDQVMEMPMTIADWAATEVRFAKHFTKVRGTLDTELVMYHEYIKLSPEEAEGKSAFIYVLASKGQLTRYIVAEEMVTLGRERLDFWNELREMSGDLISEDVRDKVSDEIEAAFEAKLDAVKAQYEAQIESLKQSYPQEVARKMAEALMAQGSNLDSFVSSVVSAPAVPVPSSPAVPTVTAPSAPAPVAITKGNIPNKKENTVIKIARSRSTEACIALSTMLSPPSRNSLANSTISMAFFVDIPMSRTNPI